MSNEMEPLPCVCGGEAEAFWMPSGRFIQCRNCAANTHDCHTEQDAIEEWNAAQTAIREHRKRKEMIEMMEQAIPDEGTDTQAEPLPCVCGSEYVACNNANNGWYGACGEKTCSIRTGFCPTADDARKRWDTIQRALRPNAVTIELPEPPEGRAWDVANAEQRVSGEVGQFFELGIFAKRIAPTTAEIREWSQAWAAAQKPGTVARYGKDNDGNTITWFWSARTDGLQVSPSSATILPAWWDNLRERPLVSWPLCLDGIGPEHVVYTPSEAGEET